MGYIRHHAIAVTGFTVEDIRSARDSAIRIFGESMVSALLHSPLNGYISFFIAPDGSKEGWEDSDNGNKLRNLFIDSISLNECLDYCEFYYGDDNGDSKVIRHN